MNSWMLSQDFLWTSEYLANDYFWLENSSNWEHDLSGYKVNTSPLALFIAFTLKSIFFLLNSLTKVSLIDNLFAVTFTNDEDPLLLFNLYVVDTQNIITFHNYKLHLLYQSDYQNLISQLTMNAPELTSVYGNFFTENCWTSSESVSLTYPYFEQALLFDWGTPLAVLAFICTLWTLVLLISPLARNLALSRTGDSYWAKFLLYLFSIVKDNRLQLEAASTALILGVFYYAVLLIGFSETLNYSSTQLSTLLLVVFASSYLTFLFKNSIHYFSLLEATATDKSLTGHLVQFLKDSSNSIAIVLRFLTLLVRLNLYDLVDDVLDSNYIFFCDFEEERFLADGLSSFNRDVHWLDTLNYRTHDRTYSSYPTLILNVDVYSLFFSVWGKIFFFLFFAFEEIGRVFLALFIIYLILWDLSTLNRSFKENARRG